jgi:hypothetical protein
MAERADGVFVMRGARRAIEEGLQHIDQQVQGIEKAVVDNPGLAFDLSRTLIESVCRWVLAQRGVAFQESDDVPKLLKLAVQNLPLLPVNESGAADVRASTAKTLGGLSTMVQGMCELRGSCGFASHGSESPKPALDEAHALLVARAADALTGFLFYVHKRAGGREGTDIPVYEDNGAFNDWVDEQHGVVRVLTEEFVSSRILFEMAPEPYRLALTEYNTREEESEDPPQGSQTAAEQA